MQLSINFYIAALAGKAFHYDGKATWTALTSGTANHFYCCWGSSPDDVWFAGSGGFLYHYTGGSPFTAYASPVASVYDVIGMWGNSSSSIWAVCLRGGVGPFSKLIYWNGTAWSEIYSSANRLGAGIWGDGTGNLYMPHYTLWGPGAARYDGVLTIDSTLPGGLVMGGVGYDGTNWWVTGGGTGPIGVGGDFTWTGSLNSWAVSDVSITAQQRADYSQGNHCWADPDSGQVFTCFYNGGGVPNIHGIRQYVPGSGWTSVHTSAVSNYSFNHIFGSDASSVLAVGGQGWYSYWNGGSWTHAQQPDIWADMRGIWGAGEPLSDVATTNDNAIVVLDGPVRESGERGEIVTSTVDAYRPG